MPKIDLTKIKEMTEEDWEKIVIRIPFMDNGKTYFDYRDHKNRRLTNWTFKPNTFMTAKESGMTMLQTLSFLCAE